MKKYLFLAGFAAISTMAMAQGKTLSPYSQYALGKMADRSVGAAKGMNGVGVAFREGNQINTLNPASYSAVDSLTFLFDAGMALQNTNLSEGGVSKNVKTANFEYAVAMFRVAKHLGMSFGILPYSNIGYNYSYSTGVVPNFIQRPQTNATMTQSHEYTGSGGLQEVYIGAGYEPVKGLSVGMNVSYMWGTIAHSVVNNFSDNTVNRSGFIYGGQASAIKFDFGAQYNVKVSKNDALTVGLTFTPKKRLDADPECLIISGDSIKEMSATDYAIPTTWGMGLAYKHRNLWRVGLDYELQKWSSVPVVSFASEGRKNELRQLTSYSNRHSIKVGGEYCKNEYSRNFADRLRYRMGMGYSSPYYYVGNNKGPRDISITASVGIPIVNEFNTRSIVNVGLSWVNTRAKNMITENTLMLNIGVTFNELWFAKWKFD